MSASFGVRWIDCGPNRITVLARVRPLLKLPPREVRTLVDRGEPVLFAVDEPRFTAEKLARELSQLGASVEVFVSTPCPSDCRGNAHDEALDCGSVE